MPKLLPLIKAAISSIAKTDPKRAAELKEQCKTFLEATSKVIAVLQELMLAKFLLGSEGVTDVSLKEAVRDNRGMLLGFTDRIAGQSHHFCSAAEHLVRLIANHTNSRLSMKDPVVWLADSSGEKQEVHRVITKQYENFENAPSLELAVAVNKVFATLRLCMDKDSMRYDADFVTSISFCFGARLKQMVETGSLRMSFIKPACFDEDYVIKENAAFDCLQLVAAGSLLANEPDTGLTATIDAYLRSPLAGERGAAKRWIHLYGEKGVDEHKGEEGPDRYQAHTYLRRRAKTESATALRRVGFHGSPRSHQPVKLKLSPWRKLQRKIRARAASFAHSVRR